MVSLVVYGIIAIGLASAAGYAFLVFSNTSRQTTQLEENQVRLETATSALRASLLALNGNGNLFPPMGQTGGAYMQLPASLGVITTAPWGQPYLYCPIAPTITNPLGGTGATVISPSGASYSVGTYTSTATQNLNYVVTTPSSGVITGSQVGYVGFIVSSLGPGQTVPDCSKITVTPPSGSNPYGGLSIAGGSVRGVTAGFPYTQRVIASTDRTEIFVGSTTTGNATGQDSSDLTSLSYALTLWQSLQPRLTEIYLEAGATGYSYAGDMNAEDVRPYAQGEGTSLVIATDPSNAAKASLTLTTPLTLTTTTTFQNLTVAHSVASGSAITTYKPLTFRNASYSLTGNAAISVFNTQLTISDTPLTNVAINGSNSTVEFYNYTNTSSNFNTTSISGNAMRVSFDGTPSSVSYSFNNSTGLSGLIGMSLGASQINVASNVVLAISATQVPGIVLNNSALNVNGTLNVSASDGSIYGSGAGGAIEALNGSSVSIATGATATMSQSGGVLDNGIFVRGSNISVNGILKSVNTAYANIGAQAANITGTGTLIIPTNATACIQFLNQGAGGGIAFQTVPIYLTPPSTGTYAGFASFASSKYGYPPMLAYTAPNAAIDTTTASSLTQASGKDPFVSGTGVAVGATYQAYVDPTTLESAIRNVVNAEFLTGINMDFTGLCQSVG